MVSENANADSIFLAAIEQPPDQRPAYLDRACGEDAALRARVERLLAAQSQGESFLDSPAPELGAAGDFPVMEAAGTVIGPYKLLEQIGEGGFGAVFLAEQQRPVKRRVALKILKPGMDTREVIARFEAERQALALMDHPNISRVYETGATDNGRPYFVMELVSGIPITDYCDECRLTMRERLELFVAVCRAIQHAHQKGVIHRDLKPTNVLVTMQDGRPAPKIIDFGVAKAIGERLTEHTVTTAFAQMIGTPMYMSPEQAELSPLGVDTRSDIYSLGVMLYELLAGCTPFDKDRLHAASYDELRRIIREEEPPRPSARVSTLAADLATTVAEGRRTDALRLSQQVRGELDWIVMKCLEKDRNRRYESASSLAREIERYLDDEPVQACPPSAAYRFNKFIRRNKLIVTAGLAVLLALVAGVLLAMTGFLQARRQARLAMAEAEKATAVHDLLQEALQSANPDKVRGTDYTVRQWLDEISRGIKDRFDDKPEVEAAIRATIGNAYRRLEVLDKAEVHLRAALELRRRRFGSESPEVAESLADYAWYLVEMEDDQGAEACAREAVAIHHKFHLSDDLAVKVLEALAIALWLEPQRFGQFAPQKFGEFQQIVEEIRRIARRHPDKYPQMANLLHWLADVTIDRVEGEQLAREAVELHRKLHGENHPETGYGICSLAMALEDQHKLDEAEVSYRQALEVFRKNYDDSQFPIIRTLSRLASIAIRKGDQAALEELRAKAVEIAAIDSADWQNWQWRGGWLQKLGQAELAVAACSRAIELKRSDADSWLMRGTSYQALGQLPLAEKDFSKAIDLAPGRWSYWYARSRFYAKQNEFDKAESDLAAAVKLCPSIPVQLNALSWSLATAVDSPSRDPHIAVELATRALAAGPHDGNSWKTLGVAQYRSGDWSAAAESLEKSIELFHGGDAFEWFFLAMTNFQLGRQDDARKWYDQAVEWTDKNAPGSEELIRFRAEAAELLGVADSEREPTSAEP